MLEDLLDFLTLGGGSSALSIELLALRVIVQGQDIPNRRPGLVAQRREAVREIDISTARKRSRHLEALDRRPGLNALAAERRPQCQHEARRQKLAERPAERRLWA